MTEQLNDPLPGLWDKWQSLEHDPANETEAEAVARYRQSSAAEKEMAEHVPLTPAGAVALVGLLKDYASENGPPLDGRQERVIDNLISGLEGMGGG